MVMQPGGDAPPDQQPAQPRQTAVYRRYLELQSIPAVPSPVRGVPAPVREVPALAPGTLAGCLVFCIGFGQPGAELALATTIAGGAFWAVESDPERLKAAIRNGSCDFMVNTLDEALRVLKNQLRKQAPLSAGLLGNAEEILAAMVERGVQPDLIAESNCLPNDPAIAAPFATFVQRGARRIPFESLSDPHAVNEMQWRAESRQDLLRMDRIALEFLPPAESIRRRWLEQAPAYFYRQLPPERVLSLNPVGRTQLLQAFQTAASAAPFQSRVTITWQDEDSPSQKISIMLNEK